MEMRKSITLLAACVALAGSDAVGGAAQEPLTVEATWSGRFEEGAGDVQLEVTRLDREGWNQTLVLDAELATRLLDDTAADDGFVSFELTREAGVVRLDGSIRRGRGMGELVFEERASFRDDMRALGFVLDDDEVFASAMLDVGPRHARELERMGFDDVDVDDLFTTVIFDIDVDYVAEMERAGFEDLDLDDLTSFRVFDVDAAFAAEARALGIGDLDDDDLVAMKVHDITPDFIREIEAMGFGDLDFDDLVAMSVHGVTGEYVRTLRAFGYDLSDVDEAVSFRIHGITPDFLRELRDAGFEGLDADEVLSIKIHGFDEILRKRRRIGVS